jgi:hypothetical protein
MLRSFVEKILELRQPVTLEVAGRPYSTVGLMSVIPPSPDCLKVNTLTGLVDYLRENRDGLLVEQLIVHVVDPVTVVVRSPIMPPFQQRRAYLSAHYAPPAFPFGQFMPMEEFVINVLAKFAGSNSQTELLKVLGNITGEASKNLADDGVTQIITARTGVARVGEVAIKNPVMLSPFRTFSEVDQPLSPFIYRLKDSGGGNFTGALFEADGGQWRLAAIDNVATYLRDSLPDDVAVLS